MLIFYQNACYPMSEQNMGHAVIINNVASEFPGTRVDAAALKETFKTMAFTVRVETDCNLQVCTLRQCLILPM